MVTPVIKVQEDTTTLNDALNQKIIANVEIILKHIRLSDSVDENLIFKNLLITVVQYTNAVPNIRNIVYAIEALCSVLRDSKRTRMAVEIKLSLEVIIAVLADGSNIQRKSFELLRSSSVVTGSTPPPTGELGSLKYRILVGDLSDSEKELLRKMRNVIQVQ